VAWLCGQEAARALRSLVDGREVRCIADERDRYKRLLAVCTAGGTNLNATMVEQGWALAFVRYSRAYVDEEDRARQAKRGL
jgi:endonuclease YncB( thermonuclease family)